MRQNCNHDEMPNLAPEQSLGEAWEACQFREIFQGEKKKMVEEGFHDLLRGYYEQLGIRPNVISAHEVVEFITSIVRVMAEKVSNFELALSEKNAKVKALELKLEKASSVSEVLEGYHSGQTPTKV